MSVASFIPELWAAKLLVPFEGALVFGQPTVANRDYEGEIQEMGDTVHINSVGDPTINDFDPGEDLEFEELSTDEQLLLIDQGKTFSFYVRDVDKAQAKGDFGGEALRRAGYKMAAAVDSHQAGVVSKGAQTANQLGRVKVVSGGTGIAGSGQITAYDLLVELGLKLDLEDVPLEGRYVVVDPYFQAAIQKDDRFASVNRAGTSETLRNGLIARAAGFDILLSNNLATVGGSGAAKDDKVIVAGHPAAFTFASQINKVEAGRAEKRFNDFVKGLNVFGSKVTRPEGLATASVQAWEPGTGTTTVVVGP